MSASGVLLFHRTSAALRAEKVAKKAGLKAKLGPTTGKVKLRNTPCATPLLQNVAIANIHPGYNGVAAICGGLEAPIARGLDCGLIQVIEAARLGQFDLADMAIREHLNPDNDGAFVLRASR